MAEHDEIRTFTVPEAGIERLDAWLAGQCPDFSRARVQGLLKAGRVTVNGTPAPRATARTRPGDVVALAIPPPVPAEPAPEAIPLAILFEDDDLIALDKPAGLVVHPAPGHLSGTLVNALLHHSPALSGIGGVARPGIVHRLDQDTSGVMVVAKSQRAMDVLTRAFASHADIRKTYLALVHGIPSPPAGRIENLIGRCPFDRKKMAVVERNGKRAVTAYRRIENAADVLTPHTGSENAADTLPPCRQIENAADASTSNTLTPCRQIENAADASTSNTLTPCRQIENAADASTSNTLTPCRQIENAADASTSNTLTPCRQIENAADASTSNTLTPCRGIEHRSDASTSNGGARRTCPLSLVECEIETGRTHQIRVHMAATLGCPIAGDALYGRPGWDRKLTPVPARQLLHAWRLALKHPLTRQPLVFEAPLPADFLPFL